MYIGHSLVSSTTLCFFIILLTTMKDGVSSAKNGTAKTKVIPELLCNGTWCASMFNQNFDKVRFSTIGIVAGGYAGDYLEAKARLTFFVRKKGNTTGTYILEAKGLVESMNHTTLSAKTILNTFGLISEDVYPVLPEPVGDGYKPYCAPLAPVPGVNICMNLYYFKCDTDLEGRACFRIEFTVYNKVLSKVDFNCVNFEHGNITVVALNRTTIPMPVRQKRGLFSRKSYASTAKK